MSTDTSALAFPLGRRALRLAAGVALCMAASFGLALPIPFIAPALAVFLFTMMPRPLSFKAAAGLLLVVLLTTSVGLLLTPVLRHYPGSGVLAIGLSLFLAFRYGLRGGNAVVSLFLVVGLTMISAAGSVAFALALVVIEALLKGLLVVLVALPLCHWLFPDPAGLPAAPAPPTLPHALASRVALRATLIVLPALLLALTDPLAYMPILMKSASLGKQSCALAARGAAKEMLGSTLWAGVLALLFWHALGLQVNLWMLFLWTLLFGLVIAARIYRLRRSRFSPGFWLNTQATMIILLGQSIQDSVAGKDVQTAFAVRMGLFLSVALYACLMQHLLAWPARPSPSSNALMPS
ncbi:DUF2955 domain-containing protein [Achromobacter aloeverae]|uniref:DUF2955 domain-containing protein n=1 Tax=Achromobacter aloeverae TaxID=1750518 RepID=A0A4Q1HE15_9BURK|nr:DUF2955 domain-containing protein [Achromobacter aloeverae]RXN84513.1 hypothetical protein C7R54_24355 [Achromobacter aloeverae]